MGWLRTDMIHEAGKRGQATFLGPDECLSPYLMALEAGLPLLDFSLIAKERKQEYFLTVRVGLAKNYAPMERLLSEIIERSLSTS